MDNIIILGANGYIGLHLTDKLIKKGFKDIKLFDIHPNSLLDYDNYFQFNIKEKIDDNLKSTLEKADYIYFFSGLTGTYKSIEKYQDFIDVNELGLLKFLDIIKSLEKKPKIIFPSTRLIYKGQKNQPLKEGAEKEFKTIYAINKFACETYLKLYHQIFDIDYTIFRICVPYANMLETNISFGTLSHFIAKAKAGDNIVLYGDGSLKRTFTHIDDLTDLVISGMNKKTNNQIFNIGGEDLTLLDVAKHIAKIFGVKIEFKEFPEIDKAIESGDTVFDGRKLSQLLRFTFQHSFKEWANNLSV